MTMTNEQFESYLDMCYDKLESKQQKFISDYNIDNFDEYWYDQDQCILQFKNNGQISLEFSVVFIGSWSGKSNSWIWSWANENVADYARIKSNRLKDLQKITGDEIFVNSLFECDQETAYELAAFSIEYLDAEGVYIAPGERSDVFMAVMSLNAL
ncbi:TPA: DUF6882 domain-containing protein [Bacillus cereus]|uniref:Uncharacterized protein n=1 Tax=Bacillus cereus (strain 03BB102) TaxID=572264 RepID=A0A158RNE3_BACC3|nr:MULTISPECIES: DUF6882 domain-containing protein [Bacillus cereus group]ABK84340.1 conserved hypothetical protein [Bacillus thuringiensis str. Al Hakam]ACO28760.1 conserved hypothetical protein [Bacillus cereus 03BB102]AJG54000.1 hypothetical protein AS54_1188 [Bacillus cereus 03BB102]AJH66668.1 hypothetical protein BF32_4232 [Bacillus thuringiensis]KXY59935.1 hypothetical protein AT275_19690 [Bacillus cereus]